MVMEMNTTTRPEEVTMPTTHATTVTPARPCPVCGRPLHPEWPAPYCSDVCKRLAEAALRFTLVEARRHVRYFENLEG